MNYCFMSYSYLFLWLKKTVTSKSKSSKQKIKDRNQRNKRKKNKNLYRLQQVTELRSWTHNIHTTKQTKYSCITNLRNIKEPKNKIITAKPNNQNHILIHKQWHKRLYKIWGKKCYQFKHWGVEIEIEIEELICQINLASLPNYPSP